MSPRQPPVSAEGEAATSPRWPAIHDFLVSGLDEFLLPTMLRFDTLQPTP